MSSFRIRPRFKHFCSMNKSEVEQKLLDALEQSDKKCVAVYLPGHMYLKIPPEERHFWSPQLHITFEESDEGTIIRGLYGPNPTVWAIFFFGYVFLGVVFFFAAMWGLTRLSLDLSATILWVLPVIVVLAFLLYIFAQTGQKIGAEQMFRLHLFYEDTIDNKVHVQ
jgi:hypothetical protein